MTLDQKRIRLPDGVVAWLDAIRRALVSQSSAYSPPGAKPGTPPSGRRGEDMPPEVRFMFVSDTEDPVCAWRATLRVPQGAKVGTSLELSVTDVGGRPVKKGAFRLAGCAIPVADGKGFIPLELFVGGLRDSRVSLSRSGGHAEGGTLSFFGLEDA